MAFPLHEINQKSKAFKVKFGDVTLGQDPSPETNGGYVDPNPKKISWSKSNRVKVHEIPYPADKTIRTSKRSLWTLRLTFRTILKDTCDKIIDMVNDSPLVRVETSTKQTPMMMYIISCTHDQEEGRDDEVIDWSLEFQEAND